MNTNSPIETIIISERLIGIENRLHNKKSFNKHISYIYKNAAIITLQQIISFTNTNITRRKKICKIFFAKNLVIIIKEIKTYEKIYINSTKFVIAVPTTQLQLIATSDETGSSELYAISRLPTNHSSIHNSLFILRASSFTDQNLLLYNHICIKPNAQICKKQAKPATIS